MAILRVQVDVSKFQSLVPLDDEIWSSDQLVFNCTRKGAKWQPLRVEVVDPAHAPGDFYHLCPGALVLGRRATEELADLVERSGELLPITCGSERLMVLNVLECRNVLDRTTTVWEYGESTGLPIRIVQYGFREEIVGEGIFKVPETAKSEVLVATGMGGLRDEFVDRVVTSGLTGLAFEELTRTSKNPHAKNPHQG